MTCENWMGRWDDGDRSPAVMAHIGACPECGAILALEAKIRALPAALVTSESAFLATLRARMSRRIPWWRLATAAAVLAGAGAAIFAGRDPLPVETPGGWRPPTATAAPPAVRPSFAQRLRRAAEGSGAEEFLVELETGVGRARLVASLRSPDLEERVAAATMAGQLGDPALAPELASLAARGNRAAIRALGRIGGIESVAVLAALAGQKDLKADVVEALAATRRPEAAEALAAMGAWDAPGWATLGESAGGAIAARLRAGGDVEAVLRAAGRSRAAGSVPEVARLLGNATLRGPAAQTLAAIGTPSAISALADAVSGTDDAVVGALRTAGGRAEIERRAADRRLRVNDRVRAVRTLGWLGDAKAVPALVKACDSPELRAEAVASLGALRDPAALPALTSALSDRGSRAAAALALARIGAPEAIPALAAAARDHGFRAEAAAAIAAIQSPLAVPALLDLVGDRSVAGTVIEALGRLRDERALPALIVALEGEHREEAHSALKSITGKDLPARRSDWVRWYRARPREGADAGSRRG
jgi:HEAT repeat protein